MAYTDTRKVRVAIPSGVEVTLDVLGTKVTVTSVGSGQFEGTHRKESLRYGDLDALRRSAERIEIEASAKTERRRRLKEAEAQPEPALLFLSGQAARSHLRTARRKFVGEARLEPIHVRGVDQRSGQALIIRENGDKETMTWALVCRPLAGVEKKRLLDLAAKEQRAVAEQPIPVIMRDVLPTLPEVDVEATWDEFTETWVATFDGEELRAPSGHNARDNLEARILARLIVKHTPYQFTAVGNRPMRAVRLVEDADNTNTSIGLREYIDLFKTEQEVRDLDRAHKRIEDADRKRRDYLETLLFDRRLFTGDD